MSSPSDDLRIANLWRIEGKMTTTLCRFGDFPWSIHHPATMMLNQASHHLFVRIQDADCPFLILSHKTAIALHICTENGIELAFNLLGGHEVPQK